VTSTSVRAWIRAGLPTITAGGKGRGHGATIELAALVRWYLEDNALDVAKTRLASAQADKHEMENALRRGELAELGAVEHSWSDLVLAFRAKMLSMPTKLGPQLINVTSPTIIASRIAEEINVALRELGAGTQDPRDGRFKGAAAPRRRARGAAAKPNGQSMGRRAPTTQ